MKTKFLVIVLIFLIFNMGVTAAQGSASLEPPPSFNIYSVDDLKAMEYNSSTITSFFLMNDIEITDDVWKPIGSANQPFSGTFYGNNYTITFTKDTELIQSGESKNNGYGLFGNIYSGRISDLNIVLDGNLSANVGYIGVLAGVVDGNYTSLNYTSSSIINCKVSANGHSVSGVNSVGGLAGYIVNGSVENSFSDCSVIAEGSNAGGLIGSVSNGTFTGCSATGSVNADSQNAGGLIGTVRLGNISKSSASGAVTSNESAGGFVGYISDETVIVNCTANGSVKPAGAFGNFIGSWNEEYKPEVINCFYQEKEVDLEPAPVTKDSNIYLVGAAIAVLFIFVVGAVYYLKKSNSN